jgi:hypothetical protein
MSRNPIPNGAIRHWLAYPYSQLRPLSPITGTPHGENHRRSGLEQPARLKFHQKGGAPEYLREQQLEWQSSDLCKMPQVPKSKENKVPDGLSFHKS